MKKIVENFQSIKKMLIQLQTILNHKQKRDAVVVFICMLIGSALELLGVSAIYPFLQMMLNYEGLKQEWYTRWIYDFMPDIETKGVLLIIGGIIILIYILKNIFLVFSAYVQNRYAAKFQSEVSTRMLGEYLKKPYSFFLNTNSSIIIRGITTDIDGVYQILLHFFTVLAESMTIMALGVFLFITDWTLAVSAMTLAVVCLFAIVFGFKGKIKQASRERHETCALKNQYGYQAINGIKEIMVLDRSDIFLEKYHETLIVEERAEIVKGVALTCPDRILEGICISGFMGIVCTKIAFGVDLATFVPVLGAFAMGAFRILPSISKISSRTNMIVYYYPSLQNVYNNIQEVENYSELTERKYAAEREYAEDLHFKKELAIQKICWKYQNAKQSILSNASLYIGKGESVALIGASGAGKTTLSDIIMGLLRPQSGMIKMDGIDIFSIPHQWAKIIGYVPQSVFLIDDTIRNNVAFGLKEDVIDDTKVWKALEQAQLKEFVENLPCGLATLVGERGVRLSGGQRQRVAIARALYEDPDILVLDEATSSLDGETESAVMDSINCLQGLKTLIIVAHRLTTIRNCDRIYEVGDGGVTERSHAEVFHDK